MKLMKRNSNQFPAFSNMLDRFFDDDFFNWPSQFKMSDRSLPAINIKETDTAFLMEVAAPGLNKEDFKVEVHNDLLTISSEQETNKESNDDGYTRREFSFSSFQRSFSLPEGVDSEAINAIYKDGILQLSIPKVEVKEEEVKRTIEIS